MREGTGMTTVDTLCRGFQEPVAVRSSQGPTLAMRGHPGLDWAEYARRVIKAAAGFAALGVTSGDKIAILTRPRPEFNIVDTALLFLRATPFSVQVGEVVTISVSLLEKTEAQIIVTEK